MSKKEMPKGKQFSSTYQPERNGRKPDILKAYISDNNLSANDVSNTIKSILPMTEKEMQDMAGDSEKPILMRLLVAAIANDIETGSVANLMNLLNRAYGAPKQAIEHSVDDTVIDQLQAIYDSKR